VVWRSGSVVRRMNEVTQRRAQLALGRAYHIGMQPSQLNQLSLASVRGR